jgi:hypothetical protein
MHQPHHFGSDQPGQIPSLGPNASGVLRTATFAGGSTITHRLAEFPRIASSSANFASLGAFCT